MFYIGGILFSLVVNIMSQFQIEDRVLCYGKLAGTVRFIGSTEFADGTWVGIELDRGKGKTNGTVDDMTYFQCEENHGAFLRENVLTPYDEREHAANSIQTVLYRGRKGRKKARSMRNARAWNIVDNNFEDLHVRKGKLIMDASNKLAQSLGGDGPLGEKRRRRSTILLSRNVKDLDSIYVEKTYKGVHVTFPLQLETVLKLLEQFKAGVPLHFKYVANLVENFRSSSGKAPTVQHIPATENSTLTVIGDLHGQLQDLYTIFTINGLPSESNRYLFNGDFVDRGECGCEVALIIFCFKLLYPDGVFINRGNHEARAQNSWMGFEEEIFGKYYSEDDESRARSLYNMFQHCFDNLSLASVIAEKVFVVHGGLFHADGITLKQLGAIRRKREPPMGGGGACLEDRIFEDLLWSDPRPSQNYPEKITGRVKSARGAGVEFGPDVTAKFCAENNIALVVRSHECVQEGFEVQHDGRLITVFSASRYCGKQTNKGAFITFGADMQPEIQQYYAHSLESNDFGGDRNHVREAVLEQDLVRMIIEIICDRKADLYWYFTQHDSDSSGFCSRSQWAETLKNVLGLDLPYLSLQHLICNLDTSNGMVNYSEFLERYRMQMSGGGKWIDTVVQGICQKLYHICSDVEDAFGFFDVDDNGKIEYDEFLKAFQALNVGLTDKQSFEIMRSIDTDNNGYIGLEEFCNRFKIAFDRVRITKEGEELGRNVGQDAHPELSEVYESKSDSPVRNKPRRSSVHDDSWVQRKLHEIGHLMFKKAERLDLAFAKYDANGEGSINREEFSSALADLGLQFQEEDVLRIFATVDQANSNSISYLEFVNAFKIDDLGLTNGDASRTNWQDSVIQMVANTLFQHRVQLRSALRIFDMQHTGKITGEEFRQALMIINPCIPQPLSQVQVDSLQRALQSPEDGLVDYKEFLESFEIVDVAWGGVMPSTAASPNRKK